MNKRFMLVITAIALCGNYAHAQLIPSNLLLCKTHSARVQTKSTSRTTSTGSRIVYQVDYDNNGVSFYPTDSAALIYYGSHGGDLTHPPIKFDVGYGFNYSTVSLSYSLNEKVVCSYDAADDLDTEVVQYWVPYIAALRNSQQALLTYDGMHNMLTDIVQNWDTATNTWVNYTKYSSTYDASNNLTEYITQTWNTGTSLWVDETDELYTYTSANKIATDINRTWNTGTSMWDNTNQTLNNYDASNNLILSVYQTWNSGTSAWDNNSEDTYTYDAMGDQLTDVSQTWNSGTSSWDNNSQKTYSGFVAQQPSTEIEQDWNSGSLAYVNSEETLNTYNSFNQITYTYNENWNAGGFWEETTGNTASAYGYQSYATKVQNISNIGGEAQVFPVPASNMLSMEITWDVPQAFAITITDQQGKPVKHWEVATSQQYNNSISVNTLPPGNYILKIDGSAGAITKRVTITN